MTEANTKALQTIVDEFKNISPEIKNAYIFTKNCETLASTEVAVESQIKQLLSAFNLIADQAATIGGVETLTIQGANNELTISRLEDNYIATVSSRTGDKKVIISLTNVIIPTVMRLVDQIGSEPVSETLSDDFSESAQTDDEKNEEIEAPIEPEEPSIEEEQPIEEETEPLTQEPVVASPPSNQLMVEKIGGLLVSPDTVRIDSGVVASWNDLYDNNEITLVHIETLEGEETTCKFKPIKEDKQNLKGIIQMPEKIMQVLHTSKGKLVLVKPVLNMEGEGS